VNPGTAAFAAFGACSWKPLQHLRDLNRADQSSSRRRRVLGAHRQAQLDAQIEVEVGVHRQPGCGGGRSEFSSVGSGTAFWVLRCPEKWRRSGDRRLHQESARDRRDSCSVASGDPRQASNARVGPLKPVAGRSAKSRRMSGAMLGDCGRTPEKGCCSRTAVRRGRGGA